jgi:hypothetical protein
MWFTPRLLLLCLIMGSIIAPATSFALTSHPNDPTATIIDTFTVWIDEHGDLLTTSAGERQEAHIIVWVTSTNRIDYSILSSTIQSYGSCAWLDSMTTWEIFARLSRAAVAKGFALGHTQCHEEPLSIPNARVFHDGCVQRTGSGEFTLFTTCDAELTAQRNYVVLCGETPQTPSINQQEVVGMSCDNSGEGCEPAYEPVTPPGSISSVDRALAPLGAL